MAIFRKINVDFWEDVKIVDDFTPEDKFFYLYLMTNPHTNQLGCYSLTIRQMEFETGYNKDTILKLLKRFSENLDVILYDEDTKEIIIKNWHKYNWSSSPKILACILKEYKEIKSDILKSLIDTLLIQYGYSIDTICIQKHNKNKNKNKEEEKEQEKDIFISSNKKINDPYINPIKNFFSAEYQKIFNVKPFLNNADCNRLVELSAEFPNIREHIPIALKRLKRINFDDINFTPTASWLLKGNNFERVMNGEFEPKQLKQNNDRTHIFKELEEKAKKEGKI